jgi:hypothetical protein
VKSFSTKNMMPADLVLCILFIGFRETPFWRT